MKKITISKEGCSPIDILVDNDGAVKTVESAGNCVYSDEVIAKVEEDPFPAETESRESIDLNSMSAADKVFAEMTRESFDPSRSEEAFPRVNSLISLLGTKMYTSLNAIWNDPKVKATCDKIKEYCAKKNWELVKETESGQLKTLWTTFIGKDTSDYNRPRAKTETWKTINGVPVIFLEFDEYRTWYDSNGYQHTSHVHYINAHVFIKKPGAKRIFSKQIITKVKLSADKSRSRESFDDHIVECVCTTESMNEIDYSNMDIQDDILKTISLESYADPSRSNESMPRLSGIQPWKHKDRVKNLFISSVNNYLKSQKINIERIKEYLDKKGWVNLGYAGLKNKPTLSTNLLRKVFGDKSNRQANKLTGSQVFETTEEGLNVVWLHTKNYNEIDVARGNDRFYKGDEVTVGYLILGKRSDPNKFFCKQITPRLKIKVETVTTSKEFTQ